MILVVAAAAFFLFRSSKKPPAPKETTGDLVQVERIESDGLVVTEDGWFVMYLRVIPVALPLKSPQEQGMIWNAFRDVVNTLSHRMVCRGESHKYDIQDYFQEYKSLAIQTEDPASIQYADELRDEFMSLMEQESVRDMQYYIRLEISKNDLSNMELDVGNPALEAILSRTRRDDGTSDEELTELARQELMNTYRVAKNYFGRIDLFVQRMDAQEVKAYLYRSVNRDTSPLVTWDELEDHDTFVIQPQTSIGKLKFVGGGE